jgi:hypothetical protein
MSQEETTSLWSFVPLQDYLAPAAPAVERVRIGFGRLWDRIRSAGAVDDQDSQVKPGPPSLAFLDEAVPSPSWSEAVAGLDAALGQWAEGGGAPDDQVRVVVSPSGAAADEIVGAWANSRQWGIVDPPRTEQILAGGKDWLAGVAQDETPRVLTRLDQFYLRHYDGLELVERLIERLLTTRGPILVGCGSWSWAYLTRTLKIDVALGQPLASQALDHHLLRDWFGQLAAGRFDFCQSGETGSAFVVRKRQRESPGHDDSPGEDSDFLRQLAAFSRGIPLIAWQGWRDSLRLESENPTGETRREATLWVPAWSAVVLPGPPGAMGPCDHAVLHELLLQGSTTAELLAHLLPYSLADLTNSLHVLRKSGLAEVGPQGWQVTRLGYPAVRESLREAGYLAGVI